MKMRNTFIVASLVLTLISFHYSALYASPTETYFQAVRLTINEPKNLEQAEQLFLSIADETPAVYAHLTYIASIQKDVQKGLKYSSAGIQQGFFDCYTYLGRMYDNRGEYDKARGIYQLALTKQLHETRSKALNYLAFLLIKGLGGAKDVSRGKDLLQESVDAGNVMSIFDLAYMYYPGDDDIPKDPKKAYELYLKITASRDTSKYLLGKTCCNIGAVLLHGLGGKRASEIQEAAKYFGKAKDAGELRGKALLATLIWTNKIKGDRERAKQDIKEAAQAHNDFAITLYSSILIAEGELTEAFDMLSIKTQRNSKLPVLTVLQIALAEQYGLGGLKKDVEDANKKFRQILSLPSAMYRSPFLAKGYIHLMGLGVPKDEEKGLKFIAESKNKVDDVLLDTYELFPRVKELEDEAIRKRQESLIREEEEQRKKEESFAQKNKSGSKKNKNSQHISKSGEPSNSCVETASPLLTPKETIFNITPEKWNKTWEVTDNSRVSSIDKERKEIRITYGDSSDQNKKEELVVKIQDNPYRPFREIKFLYKDPRIEVRKKSGTSEEIRNHNFAQMLDYVIQGAAVSVPWIKDGSVDVKDMLVTEVKRVNSLTNESVDCTAEYTFYAKNGRQYLYHCLLRPVKTQSVIEDAQL